MTCVLSRLDTVPLLPHWPRQPLLPMPLLMLLQLQLQLPRPTWTTKSRSEAYRRSLACGEWASI
jgi:hypothetical protein